MLKVHFKDNRDVVALQVSVKKEEKNGLELWLSEGKGKNGVEITWYIFINQMMMHMF